MARLKSKACMTAAAAALAEYVCARRASAAHYNAAARRRAAAAAGSGGKGCDANRSGGKKAFCKLKQEVEWVRSGLKNNTKSGSEDKGSAA
jgi:hypothetical protein